MFHFDSKLDYVTASPGDLGTLVRQAELDEVAAGLAAGFGPTKVLIERPYAERGRIGAEFRQYLNGTRMLAAGEAEQLGFRIAARAGHQQVYPVDILHRFMEPSLEALISSDSPAARQFAELLAQTQAAQTLIDQTLARHGLRAALAELNTAERRQADLAVYLDGICRLDGDADDASLYAGADATGNWYHRNVRIFANILRATGRGDRLLAIYGAAHVPVLAHLAEASGHYQLVDPAAMLTE
jgi:Family of unknown function (DUF5694)